MAHHFSYCISSSNPIDMKKNEYKSMSNTLCCTRNQMTRVYCMVVVYPVNRAITKVLKSVLIFGNCNGERSYLILMAWVRLNQKH